MRFTGVKTNYHKAPECIFFFVLDTPCRFVLKSVARAVAYTEVFQGSGKLTATKFDFREIATSFSDLLGTRLE